MKVYGLLGAYALVNLLLIIYFTTTPVVTVEASFEPAAEKFDDTSPTTVSPSEVDPTDIVSLNTTCETLQGMVSRLLDVEVTKTETPFADADLGLSGIDCNLTFPRSSTEDEDYLIIAQEVKADLETQGWHEDPTFIAYGPNEISLALTKNEQSGILTVGWQPATTPSCATKRALTICKMESRLYQVNFNFTIAPLGEDETSL